MQHSIMLYARGCFWFIAVVERVASLCEFWKHVEVGVLLTLKLYMLFSFSQEKEAEEGAGRQRRACAQGA